MGTPQLKHVEVGLRATIQFCTYNRAYLLGRVLRACFEQTVASDAYEVVLVNDGSSDETPRVIEEARRIATCGFSVVDQANTGLARARNAGIARARGERIIFIDDDVLPTPAFVAEHLHSHDARPGAIVRGAVINTETFDRLPTPTWTLANYSGNFFWTSNVSVPLATLRGVGNFSEAFGEYGWEDIELGLRLRSAGVKAVFNRFAVAFHYKPRPRAAQVASMLRQARAQARMAVRLRRLHPHWRVVLATGDDPLRRTFHRAVRRCGALERLASAAGNTSVDRELSKRELAAARALARETYYDELEAARRSA